MAAEDRRLPQGTGAEYGSHTPQAESRRAVLPETLHDALDKGAALMRIMPRGAATPQNSPGLGIHASDSLTPQGLEQVKESLSRVVADFPIRDSLQEAGVTEAVLVTPLYKPEDPEERVPRGRLSFGRGARSRSVKDNEPMMHGSAVQGGDPDEQAYTLTYTTLNPAWGRGSVDVTVSVVVPESTAFAAARALRDPATRHAFIDQVAVDQAGIPSGAWRNGSTEARELRPNYEAWAAMNDGESGVYVDVNETYLRTRGKADRQLVTKKPFAELPLVPLDQHPETVVPRPNASAPTGEIGSTADGTPTDTRPAPQPAEQPASPTDTAPAGNEGAPADAPTGTPDADASAAVSTGKAPKITTTAPGATDKPKVRESEADTNRTHETVTAEAPSDPLTVAIENLTAPKKLSTIEKKRDEDALQKFADHVTEQTDPDADPTDVMSIIFDVLYEGSDDDMERITPEVFADVTGDLETSDLLRVLRRLNTYEHSGDPTLDDDSRADLNIARSYLTDILRDRPEVINFATPSTTVAPTRTHAEQIAEKQIDAEVGHTLGENAKARTMGDKVVIISEQQAGDGACDVFVIQGKDQAGNTIGLQGVRKQEVPTENGGTMLLFHIEGEDGEVVTHFIAPNGETSLNFGGVSKELVPAQGKYVKVPTANDVIIRPGELVDGAVPIVQDVWGRIIGNDGRELEPFVPESDFDFWGYNPDAQQQERTQFTEFDPVIGKVFALLPIIKGEIAYYADRENHDRPGFSGIKQERVFRIPHYVGDHGKDRIIMGTARGHLLAAEPGEHVVIYGSSGSGKSESVIMPNILNHHGNVISTATDPEIYLKTSQWARSKGDVFLFDPYGETGDKGHIWNPLQHTTTWADAREFAHDLIVGSQESQGGPAGGGDDYWYKQAEGLLAPLLYVNAHSSGGNIEVVMDSIKQLTSPKKNSELHTAIDWLHWREEVMEALIAREGNKEYPDPEALGTYQSTLKDAQSAYKKLVWFRNNLEANTGGDNVHSALTFAENAMAPWENAEVREATMGKGGMIVDEIWGNDDPNNNPSLYMVAPEDKQDLLKGVFTAFNGANYRAAIRHNKRRRLERERRPVERAREWDRIKKMPRGPEKKEAKRKFKREVEPKQKPPVLMAIDEAANIAPLPKLANKMSLARKQELQFLVIFQDGSQIETVYGPTQRGTIENNANGAVVFMWNSKDFESIGKYSDGIGEVVVMEKRKTVTKTKGTTTHTKNHSKEGGSSTTYTPDSKSVATSEERVTRPIVPRTLINRLPKYHALVYARGYPTEIELVAAKDHVSTRHKYGLNPSGMVPKATPPEYDIEEGLTAIDVQPTTRALPKATRGALTGFSGGESIVKQIKGRAEPQISAHTTIGSAEKEHAAEKQSAKEQAAAALAAGQTLPQGPTLPKKGGTTK